MRNIIEYKDFRWIDIIEPTDEDMKYIEEEFKLHPVTLKNIIPAVAHPDFDLFQDYVSMILHYPRNEESGNVEIHELDVVVGKNYFITSHYKPIKPLTVAWEECASSDKLKEKYMGSGAGTFLFLILNKFLKRILEKTDKIGQSVAQVEKDIFVGEEIEKVKKISLLKRQIISFWRGVDPQGSVFYSLKNIGPDFFGEAYKYYFSDLFRTFQRIHNSLEAYKETIESLEETNHNIINVKRTEIMKILTVFSVILLPLTLMASIWGMNTNLLPFKETPFDFWIIMTIMGTISAGMIIYFKIKKWL